MKSLKITRSLSDLMNQVFIINLLVTLCFCVILCQDVSCNELKCLPAELGQLECLRDLNLRRNHLTTLPEGRHTPDVPHH